MSIKSKLGALGDRCREGARTVRQFMKFRPGSVDRRILIVGCQRSGTTMLGRCFAKDIRVREYGEYGLSGNDLRIPPLDVVESIAQKQHAPVMVFKPLVESHRTLEMLKYFPNSTAIWMFRHYKDVANSSFRRFGIEATIKNVGSIARDDRSHWMAEGASESVREMVHKYYADDMPALDGKALTWFIRNSLYFEQDLQNHPKVTSVLYSDFVADPDAMMRKIYAFSDIPYPGSQIVASVHTKSMGLGKKIELSPEIAEVCESMWQRIQKTMSRTNS